MSPEELRAEVDRIVAENGGELPSVEGRPFLKVIYGPPDEVERIWIRPIQGDDCDGIGMFANQPLHPGNWGDFVAYSLPAGSDRQDLSHVVAIASNAGLEEAVERSFSRVDEELRKGETDT